MGKATVSGRSKTNTFVYMRIGAKHMLEQALRSDEGQLYNIISCLTYSAFTLEAYFNHLGKMRNPNWDKIERKYPKLKKYKLFCHECNVSFDFEKPPYSTMIELFSFRDCMAHGKSTVDYVAKEIDFNSELPNQFSTGPSWREYATIANAEKGVRDVDAIIFELHTAAGYTDNLFNNPGGGVYGVQRHET